MNVAGPLHDAIAVVCPILGVSVGDATNKATWIITFDPSATAAQQSAAQNVVTNFNPSGPQVEAQSTFEAALSAGVTLTWTTSTSLNDTYPIDTATQVRMVVERLSVAVNSTFTNGTTTLTWFGITGAQHSMSMSQAGAFVKSVWAYLTALFVARATAANGGTPAWPSSNVIVNA